MKSLIGSLLFLLFCSGAFAGDTLKIDVKVEDTDNPSLWLTYFALNKRTGQGTFGDHWGRFQMTILKNDTIYIRAHGYETSFFCLKDSASAEPFRFTVKLIKSANVLPVVDIVPVREFKEIEKDIQRLEKIKTSDYAQYNSLKSPITAMYERFSNIGKQKALVSELEYEDAKRALLKELLAKYVAGDILILSETEFDDFITFCNPNMEFIKSSSQYDLIMYFKARYEEYNRFVRHR